MLRTGGRRGLKDRIQLYGFNNLTKTLSFNIYDICYAKSAQEKREYLVYIDEQYNSERLTAILRQVTETIGAQILHISKQDYEPQGASVNILVAESRIHEGGIDPSCNRGLLPREVSAHLDKSHVTVHTFPEAHPSREISTFRVDIDVATCGTVSPLRALDGLIQSFDSDIITCDYRVRGFTRDTHGKKCFLDHPFRSIQDYIAKETLRLYDAMDVNVYQANLFHSKLMRKEIHVQDYLFNREAACLKAEELASIRRAVKQEMLEIYSGMNIYED